jgi:hypothetical protein
MSEGKTMREEGFPSAEKALDHAGNLQAPGCLIQSESLIHRPIAALSKRKSPCVFITIATPI